MNIFCDDDSLNNDNQGKKRKIYEGDLESYI
jgi:hypothetical protein